MSAYTDLILSVQAEGACMYEEGALGQLELPDELHLQALWFAGQMGRSFQTTDGKEVKIVQFGHWNHGAGPDFSHVSVEIDGELFSGPLELDHHASDWESHGHAVNEAFNDVVLHVVFASSSVDHYTRTANHREVPRVCVPESITREAMNLPFVNIADAHSGRCSYPLANMESVDVDSLLKAAAKHRAQTKLKRKHRVMDVAGCDEWLWQAIVETMGYRPNKLAMTLLAQRISISELRKKPEDVEAILFGAAGFLSVDLYKEAASDSQDYLRDLWENWWRIRHDYEPIPERAIPWTLSGIRPVNHPQRRLACLVSLVSRWDDFKKVALSDPTGERLVKFFQNLNHPFWNYHYTLKSKRSDKLLVLMGADRLRDFQINHLLPEMLAADDVHAWRSYLKIPAPSVSEKVDKASTRLFRDTKKRKMYLKYAWQHQALLQVYQDFCLRDFSDCEDCPFPEQLAHWRNS